MSSVWERFNNIASSEEVKEAMEKKKEFAPLEAGEYECVLEEMTPALNKTGLPMLKGKFRTKENRVIFYNQMLQNLNYPEMTAVNIADAIDFVGGLTGEELSIEELGGISGFENYISEKVIFGSVYKVRVSYGKKDVEKQFPKLAIIRDISDNEDFVNIPDNVEDDGLPFN